MTAAATAEAALKAPGASRPGGWLVFPLLVLGAVLVYPLVLMGTQAFVEPTGGIGLDRFHSILGSAVFRSALFNTLRIALTATAMCLALGLILALLISFVPFPGSRVLSRLIDAYLAYPSFLIALSLTFLYGNSGVFSALGAKLFGASPNAASFLYGFWGVVLAEVTFYTPFVMRPLLAAFDTMDHTQLEVASSLGEKPFGVLRRIVLPAAMPSLLAGGSLCLLLTLNEFGIILVMGAKDVITLPMLIYNQAIQQFDYPGASVVALCNIALSLALYFVYRGLLARSSA